MGTCQFEANHGDLSTPAHTSVADILQYGPKHHARSFTRGRHDDGPDVVEMLYQIDADYVDFAAITEGLSRVVQGDNKRS